MNLATRGWRKKKNVKATQGTSIGPTNNWKILSDNKWVMVSNGVKCFKWWVMGDENWVMNNHFFKRNKLLFLHFSCFLKPSSTSRISMSKNTLLFALILEDNTCMVLKLYTSKEEGDLNYFQLGKWLIIGFHSLVLLFFNFFIKMLRS